MTRPLSAPPADFAPDLLSIQEQPPARLPRAVGYVTGGLFVVLAGWATFGQLDIVATAEGRLAPRNYSRVLQPASQPAPVPLRNVSAPAPPNRASIPAPPSSRLAAASPISQLF